MADTWDIDDPLRPHLRPEGLVPEPPRPHLRPAQLGAQPVAHVPEAVADDATQRGALALDRTSLIGLLRGPKGNHALLRLASGAVVKVQPGESVDGGRVMAIDERGLRLQRGGEVVLLTMPS
ncbi:hypothetical protein [Rubellimicrobium arenae]|uniref:hypothetical protein n=1 Tax=Rubellimicrobium arenae TaxID=2817372 RepID=UPI001B30BE8B|nr:hypothetical protein [Rubellimicrobium arenae]